MFLWSAPGTNSTEDDAERQLNNSPCFRLHNSSCLYLQDSLCLCLHDSLCLCLHNSLCLCLHNSFWPVDLCIRVLFTERLQPLSSAGGSVQYSAIILLL